MASLDRELITTLLDIALIRVAFLTEEVKAANWESTQNEINGQQAGLKVRHELWPRSIYYLGDHILYQDMTSHVQYCKVTKHECNM